MQQKDSIDSDFSVTWTHRLRFTDTAFKDGTIDTLFQILSPLKVLPVLDRGVVTNTLFMDDLTNWVSSTNIATYDPLIVDGGEHSKNSMQVVNQVLGTINTNNFCRKSCILVIGGGAVLDAVGYAASIAHRGIPIIRMPSTTLSQCDSGIGVKNAINYFGKKNFVGVFDPPFAVVNDTRLLSSLDDRQWCSGLSEAIKVALIKDATFFNEIEAKCPQLIRRETDTMRNVIKKSAILHLEHITKGGDPFERLDARPLDFGHWAAHKLEQITNHSLTHGEAVSIGLVIDIKCSVALGLLESSIAERIIGVLDSLGLPTKHPALADPELLNGIEEFRQHIGGRLTLLMLTDIAKPIDIHALDMELVKQVFDELL
jgi:3-dehydroquinate synthase